MPKDIDQKYLREAIEYNPLNGMFMWRSRPVNHFADLKYGFHANHGRG